MMNPSDGEVRLPTYTFACAVHISAAFQEEMRRKRLAREGGERNREIRLLAEREMAGRPLPDERRMAYNNQYHAYVARQNRPR